MNNIALAFSGGGFRAAAFSLGTLSYLNGLRHGDGSLLDKVRFIGSTSGGSITNLAYAAGICDGKNFDQIYQQLFKIFEGDELMAKVFKILADDNVWKQRPQKSRNLINAFSIAYDDSDILDGKTMELYSRRIAGTHLEEITVNATEFSNGISFRFQTRQDNTNFPKGRVGNNYIYFNRSDLAVADQLKLGDILACSSCFPGGFEPFLFPDDFSHKNLGIEELSDAITFKTNPFSVPGEPNDLLVDEEFKELSKGFGLMDGGIADNQAIDSVVLAHKRRFRAGLPIFDLIIATDVTSYFMDGYTLPVAPKSKKNGSSLRSLNNILLVAGLILPLLVITSFTSLWRSWMYLLVPLTLAAGFIWLWLEGAISKARSSAESTKSTWLIVSLKYGKYFTGIGLKVLSQMLLARLKSVFLLTEDIYLKQIRRHYYNMVYSDPELSPIFISNAIYDLSKVKQKAVQDTEVVKVLGFNSMSDDESAEIPKPSVKLIETAESARLMPTTLWFDQHHVKAQMREAVIATGQFTTCYNLLKHVIRLEKTGLPCAADPAFDASACTALKAQLLADWARFNQDPYFMIKR
ncbi:patatin-like phospholipase family protein [Pedobacter sp. MC2016-15]|uniref:patatin-like phospholipase family protein n=1 Tax=Pedobacter sp. MC2016-15 TaxID=2994473 RepID=UPI002248460F|nr:patatin-like phospholipase family protein [Pedobacter sp. MC2016-15]MCX2481485.1 patatin-like phospholipase family protein [Pedobacter sp. MC2016-15]